MSKVLALLLLMGLQSCIEATDNPRPNLDLSGDGEVVTTPGADSSTTTTLLSQSFRARGAAQLTYTAQTENIIEETQEGQYLIPLPELHNEALIPRAAKIPNDCGIDKELVGLSARIKDCEDLNGVTFTSWKGVQNGISGEGNFRLVQKSDEKLIWLDETTGMVWSYRLKDDYNWQDASGADMNIDDEDYLCGSIRSIPNTEVVFRLPTRNDYLIADVNGARYVLPDTEATYWTATSIDSSMQAWAVNLSTGASSKESKDDALAVRCIGHVIKFE